jgi:hypothetical protein
MRKFKAESISTGSRLASFAKGLLVSGGAVFAIKSLTAAASRAQETMNLFNTVFAENSAATAKWADNFARDVGRSKTEVKEWAASLQDTFVPLGFARDRAAELSKTLVELAVDVGSFKNIASDREVIDAFTSAVVGNHRAVRAYGVVITNATIEGAAFKAGIKKTFTELTELEKVQLRYNLILAGTLDAQGDAIKTADNYANRVKKLKGQMTDLAETVGNSLLPSMTRMVNLMTARIIPIAKGMSRVFSDNNKWIISLITKTAGYTAALWLSLKAIKAVRGAINLITKAYKGAVAWKIALDALSGPAGWAIIAAGVAIAIGAIVSLNEAVDGTLDRLQKVGEVVKVISKETSVKVPLGDLDLAGLEGARLSTIKEIAKEQELIAFWGKTWGEDITKNLKNVKDLEGKLIRISGLQRKIQRTAAETARLQELAKLEDAAFAGLSKFTDELKNKFDEVGLTTLEAGLRRIEKLGDPLSGKAFSQFSNGLKEARDVLTALEGKQHFLELAEDAKALTDSLKGPAEKLLDIREKLAEMLEQGFISTEDFDKGLAKARNAFASKDIDSGRFQEIRSEFIDVAALNAGSSQSGIQKNNTLTEETNKILERIANQGQEVFPA